MKATTSVVEDYLQVLHYLTRDGYPVIAARLAERLNVTPPTVTATLQRMERDGLIERLLTDLLKMPWHESHEEAHGVEHVMTPNIEARLLLALGNPTTCPHGNPIPGLGTLNPDEFPLDEAQTGDELVIQRITEEAEQDLQLMKYLQEHGVEPGARMTVREATRFNALVVLEGPHGPVPLGFPVAAKLRARRV
jgi:DtxR family transcriptional regulator, Mn-dependent transcriptional regulator